MLKHGNANAFTSQSQERELLGSVIKNFPKEIPSDWAQYLIESPKELQLLLKAVTEPITNLKLIRADWERFYQEVFQLKVDFSQLPVLNGHLSRIMYFPVGLTDNQVLKTYNQYFRIQFAEGWFKKGCQDPNKLITHDDRHPRNGAYVIRAWYSYGLNSEYLGLSANQLDRAQIKGMTLMERIILGLKIFLGTKTNTDRGIQLDHFNYTLCSGSRTAQGLVPFICHDSAEGVMIKSIEPNKGDKLIGVREVIELAA